jgi:hypothetical protein
MRAGNQHRCAARAGRPQGRREEVALLAGVSVAYTRQERDERERFAGPDRPRPSSRR